MEPITIVEGTGLILSLIPLFQRKRDTRENAKKEEFYAWLIEHKFQDVKDIITETFGMEVQIEALLQMNQEQLLARFNEVDQKLFCIMNSMQEFRTLVKIVAPKARLTEQEESILRQFVEIGAPYLTNYCNEKRAKWLAGSKEINANHLTINASLKQLVIKGFLCELHNNNLPYYELTEQAIEYVNNLKKSDLSEQAKSILKQYVESGEQYLDIYFIDTQIVLEAGKKQIDFDNPRFISEDVNHLIKQGFIQFIKNITLDPRYINFKRHALTRKGEEYINSIKEASKGINQSNTSL